MIKLFGQITGGIMENYCPIFKFAVRKDLINSEISFEPRKAHDDDTGWDVKCAKSISIKAGQYAKIPLGIRVFAPTGWWLELRPRSSTFTKKQLHCLYGVIDNGFESEICFAAYYCPDISSLGQDLKINFGDAIGQLIPIKRQEMKVEIITNEDFETLCKERNATRGIGGFGSSD